MGGGGGGGRERERGRGRGKERAGERGGGRERELTPYLVSIPDSLCKDTVVVPQSIAVARQLESSHGVNETGSKSSQTTITKTSIFLLLLQVFKIQTKLRTVYGRGEEGRQRERERESGRE